MLPIYEQHITPAFRYRVYNLKDKKTCPVMSIAYDDYGDHTSVFVKNISDDKVDYNTLPRRDFILMPSTGCKDMYTNPIFMWDLVKFTRGEDEQILGVFWDNGWRVLGFDAGSFKYWSERGMEVIGNKYDNPDMWREYTLKVHGI